MTWRLLGPFGGLEDCEKVVVFANTGREKKETLDFVNECDKKLGFKVVWVESITHHNQRKSSTHRVVSFDNASRVGEPFEDMIRKYGIPNKSFPHCTRELKTNPIHSYVKNELGWDEYTTAIGIRSDEIDRINPKNIRDKNYWYPLADWKITKQFVNEFWDSDAYDFTLNLKDYEGNCDFCWKKTRTKLKKISLENPNVIVWWKYIELKYGHFIPKGRDTNNVSLPIVFGRGNLSIDQIISNEEKDDTPDLLNDYCEESCEPFN